MHIPKGPFHPHQELLQGQLLYAGKNFLVCNKRITDINFKSIGNIEKNNHPT